MMITAERSDNPEKAAVVQAAGMMMSEALRWEQREGKLADTPISEAERREQEERFREYGLILQDMADDL